MELTKKQVSITKGVAILFMLLLHLFCTKYYQGLFIPLIMIKGVPLVYYLALFGDCCVAIYCFCSGYGLMCTYKNNLDEYNKRNSKRILKLYINFWIIILLFVVLLGYLTGNSATYPGNIKTFILNVTAISVSYNGAWWFLTTYIILVVLSKFINKVVEKYNNVLITLIVFVIYCICYVQRINVVITFENPILNWAITQVALLGTSLFPFVVGVIFANKKIYSFIYNMVHNIKFKNTLFILGILFMIVCHGFVQTLFVAVFTGIAFIVLFNLIDKPDSLDRLLYYLSSHSTNMWLTHMFFYMVYFKSLVFMPKYPLFIFIWLILLCLISSYLIKFFYFNTINKFNISNIKSN